MESDQENSGRFAPKKHDETEGKEEFILRFLIAFIKIRQIA